MLSKKIYTLLPSFLKIYLKNYTVSTKKLFKYHAEPGASK